MMTSQVLRVLERRGLVTREVSPDDSRAIRLAVTAPGIQLALEAIQVVEATDAEFFAEAGKREPVVDLLRRLAG